MLDVNLLKRPGTTSQLQAREKQKSGTPSGNWWKNHFFHYSLMTPLKSHHHHHQYAPMCTWVWRKFHSKVTINSISECRGKLYTHWQSVVSSGGIKQAVATLILKLILFRHYENDFYSSCLSKDIKKIKLQSTYYIINYPLRAKLCWERINTLSPELNVSMIPFEKFIVIYLTFAS